MEIIRTRQIKELLRLKDNGMIKAIVGLRGTGKSFFLDRFSEVLRRNVPEECVITVHLKEKKKNIAKNEDDLLKRIKKQTHDDKLYYLLLDDIEVLGHPASFLKKCARMKNIDIYFTASNRNVFAGVKDVEEFVQYPLTFKEYLTYTELGAAEGWQRYLHEGGVFKVIGKGTNYLKNYYETEMMFDVFIGDMRLPVEMFDLAAVIAENSGVLTNYRDLSKKTKNHDAGGLSPTAAVNYAQKLVDAYLIEIQKRTDISSEKELSRGIRVFCTDPGMQNAMSNFTATEDDLLMSIIYRQLTARGYRVEYPQVYYYPASSGKSRSIKLAARLEFAVYRSDGKVCFITLADNEDEVYKKKKLLTLADGGKVLIMKNSVRKHMDYMGIHEIGLMDFLLFDNILDKCF